MFLLHMDTTLFEFINGLAGHSTVVDNLFIYLTNYGPMLFVLILLAIWFSRKNKLVRREAVLFALTITFVALFFNQLIELIYFRSRPFVTGTVSLLIEKSAESTSFPSNHAAGAFAIAFALYWRKWKYGALMIILAILLAFSRVFVGVHYPLDVLSGALVALLAFLLVSWQQKPLERVFQSVLTRFQKVEEKIFNRS